MVLRSARSCAQYPSRLTCSLLGVCLPIVSLASGVPVMVVPAAYLVWYPLYLIVMLPGTLLLPAHGALTLLVVSVCWGSVGFLVGLVKDRRRFIGAGAFPSPSAVGLITLLVGVGCAGLTALLISRGGCARPCRDPSMVGAVWALAVLALGLIPGGLIQLCGAIFTRRITGGGRSWSRRRPSSAPGRSHRPLDTYDEGPPDTQEDRP
jgi:hypothetical protein